MERSNYPNSKKYGDGKICHLCTIMKQLKAYRPLQICLLDTLCIEEMCLKCLSIVNSFKKYLNILITIPTNKSFPWKSDMRGLLNVYVTKFVCETHQFAISRCHFSHPPGPYRWHSYLYGCHIYFPSLNLYDSSSNWREDLNRECVCLYSLFMWKITVEGGVYVKG